MPAVVAEIIDGVCDSRGIGGDPPTYDDELGNRMSGPGLGGVLALDDHLRACLALGLVDPKDFAAAAGIEPTQLSALTGVSDVMACIADK